MITIRKRIFLSTFLNKCSLLTFYESINDDHIEKHYCHKTYANKDPYPCPY